MASSFLFIILVISSCYALDNVRYRDCGSQVGKVKSLSINPCTSQPCILKRGTNVTVTINFSPSESIKKIQAVVFGVLEGVPIPFPLPNPNGCSNSGVKCPLEKSAMYKYHSIIPVKKIYPAVTLIVRWELKNSAGKKVVCLDIPASIE
ncbi:expressed hypothetical protein [Trichoplax adhaerens]|uniref:MD-2-related lipid-recognition domain-containing protein n=1 Tax=Trichoplax adhaerens TaxID=10228 RepID=B3RMY9_TRIAD|nr:expressed hypothetical protein [Trichoplax adhaerens]EDV27931.1 expressed hypothetical protein [Trichoplax adhaerens]|eukprot:XP_002109765.1 expressed hypothetical protein [Trichoplax adhaerens]